ncbi:MAG: 3'-5' exonuclease [Piscinibacter sp.]|nr:3'-5' exonuclease [Piscinibacter sp.]
MSWWQRLRGAPAADPSRWLVVDVEASGLDAERDRLLAIAGVAVRVDGPRPWIVLDDSFEVVLRQPEAAVDKPNILLHGIGVAAQRAGCAPDEALRAFLAWRGRSPLLAFHAAFDATLIRRALRDELGEHLPQPWADLADLARVLHPEAPQRSLDDWLARFEIVCLQRHQAAADALATAELLLRLWPALRAQGAGRGFDALRRLAAHRRWMPV